VSTNDHSESNNGTQRARGPLEFRGRWVLVTGASSGLGLEIARRLAREHGANIIAVARRQDRLTSLAAELESQHGVKALPIAADLTKSADLDRLYDTAIANREVHGVVLNAGITFYGHVLDQPADTIDSIVATNVSSVVHLTMRFAKYLTARANGGGIMLVSSTAGLAPMPYQSLYGATKSFVTSFGRGLAHELRDRGVSVTVFAPGGIATEMLDIAGLSAKFKPGDMGIMPADRCAEHAVRAFVQRADFYVPGALNRVLATAMKLAPHGVVVGQIARLYKGGLTRQ
jgi:short-subunit dehydrogenase